MAEVWRSDTNYRDSNAFGNSTQINGAINSLSLTVASTNDHRPQQVPDTIFYLSQSLVTTYTGRSELLHRIKSYLCPSDINQEHRRQGRKTALIHGPSGYGKTQLATKLSNELRESFQYVLWVDLTSEATAQKDYEAILQKLCRPAFPPDRLRRDVGSALAESRVPWLLVLDNANDTRLIMQHYYPPGDDGCVVVISTNATLQYELPSEASFAVGEMSEEDAAALFVKVSRVKAPEGTQKAAINRITASSGRHPYATVLFAHYARERDLSPTRFEQSIAENDDWIRIFDDGKTTKDNIFKRFDATLDLLLRTHARAADAVEFLRIIAILSPRGIEKSVFLNARKSFFDLSPGEKTMMALPALLDAGKEPWNETRMCEVIRCLREYSLIQVDTMEESESLIQIHDLVRTWVQHRCLTDARAAELSALTVIGLAARKTDVYNTTSLSLQLKSILGGLPWSTCNSDGSALHGIIQRLREAYEYNSHRICADVLRLASVCSPLAAEAQLKDLYKRLESKGKSSPETTIIVLQALQQCAATLGRHKRSARIQCRLLRTLKSCLGSHHVDTLMARIKLIDCHYRCGRSLRAESTYQKVSVAIARHPVDAASDLFLTLQFELQRCRILLQNWDDLPEEKRPCEDFPCLRQNTMEYPQDLVAALAIISEKPTPGLSISKWRIAQRAYSRSCAQLGREHPLTAHFFRYAMEGELWPTQESWRSSPVDIRTFNGTIFSTIPREPLGLARNLGPCSPVAMESTLRSMLQRQTQDMTADYLAWCEDNAYRILMDASQRKKCLDHATATSLFTLAAGTIFTLSRKLPENSSHRLALRRRSILRTFWEQFDYREETQQQVGRLSNPTYFCEDECCGEDERTFDASDSSTLALLAASQRFCAADHYFAGCLLSARVCHWTFHMGYLLDDTNDWVAEEGMSTTAIWMLLINTQLQADAGDQGATEVLAWARDGCGDYKNMPDATRKIVPLSYPRQLMLDTSFLFFARSSTEKLMTTEWSVGALKAIKEYWRYRERVWRSPMEPLRAAANALRSIPDSRLIAGLIIAFADVCGSAFYQPSMSQEWDQDVETLQMLCRRFSTRETGKYPRHYKPTVPSMILRKLRALSEISQIKSALRDLECFDISYYTVPDLMAKYFDDEDLPNSYDPVCSASDVANSNLMTNRGYFRFLVNITLFLASGFVWESWRDEEEDDCETL